MRVGLNISVDKPSPSGRVFPRKICEDILSTINGNSSTLFVVNRVGVTPEVDMSRAVGMITPNSATIADSGEITVDVTFFKRQFALAQPFDAQKYPHVGTQGGGCGNSVEQLAESGGLKFIVVGSGEVDQNKVVTAYRIVYIHTEPL